MNELVAALFVIAALISSRASYRNGVRDGYWTAKSNNYPCEKKVLKIVGESK